MSFSERLKQLRNEHNLTQEQLGKKINVTKVSISGYENGNRTPDMETLQKIADVFEISVDYLLGRIDEPSLICKASNNESDWLAFINGERLITEEEKEYLKESLELFRRMRAKIKE